ncbi:unnamed protein product [Vitrella brassicaformis CCMP3155]|uniref:Protein kinase domain-containing protein n=1 Tax=Vitrella brassicaformis (strain CCMP3155) TaxID=1169540 RepID=A0A0G4EBG6_VITBC|nr:unnamed protein product [Vitrella brassicaformis CCMP3155]|eukprot:CEL92612.1 unnamed protein product [Vitrella brassicaformis CCMP3155]
MRAISVCGHRRSERAQRVRELFTEGGGGPGSNSPIYGQLGEAIASWQQQTSLRRQRSTVSLIKDLREVADISHEYNIGKLIHERRIDEELISAVHEATDTRTGRACIVKKVAWRHWTGEMTEAYGLLRDVTNHPHLARVIDVVSEPGPDYAAGGWVYVAMERCDGVDLPKWREEHHIFHSTCRQLIKQLLLAVRHLHASQLVHGDIKAENCIFDGRQLKVIDYDTCITRRGLLELAGGNIVDRGGTVEYTVRVAIQQVFPFHLDESMDLFARRVAIDADPPNLDDCLPEGWEGAVDLTKKLQTFQWDDRPSADEALQHWWRQEEEQKEAEGAAAAFPPPPAPQSAAPTSRRPFVRTHYVGPPLYTHIAPPPSEHTSVLLPCPCPSAPRPARGYHVETHTKVPDGTGGWRVVQVERHVPPRPVWVYTHHDGRKAVDWSGETQDKRRASCGWSICD